ncbi:ribosomal protein S18-alanine N-acetyltransferase [Vogesella sp. DC21W]|uniref:[Ribosomal protein bS18]-alanine N-acetyltransferase n=1 Tax=Vogesella aquatica TaxID=2984206 RepID=A0ABT5IXI5_9NEIS|nr:ribosomal protein S18-alanine N-acetyltransferase [Vogesella aquatica]MDC7717253.1 ribosomal protein S18-alanine N-acetyltransferase [Vogesella aquatica]
MADFTRAKPEDAQRLARSEADSTPHAWSAGMYAGSLESEHDTVWLMLQDDILLGAAVLMQVLDEAHLQNFFINAKQQGRGLGGQLLRHVLLQARQQGAGSVFLEVRASNRVALQLYQRAGFIQYSTRKAYYRHPDGSREDAILMKADL